MPSTKLGTHRIHVGQVLQDFEANSAIPRHRRGVSERMDEQPIQSFVLVGEKYLPPRVVWHLDDRATQAPDRSQLGLHRTIRHDDGARQPHPARMPGDALCHIAGARRPNSPGQSLLIGQENGIARATQLERTDGLQVFQLEKNLRRRVVDVEAEQWGTKDHVSYSRLCGANLLEWDRFNWIHVTCLPGRSRC
jgi:hypothetical protein